MRASAPCRESNRIEPAPAGDEHQQVLGSVETSVVVIGDGLFAHITSRLRKLDSGDRGALYHRVADRGQVIAGVGQKPGVVGIDGQRCLAATQRDVVRCHIGEGPSKRIQHAVCTGGVIGIDHSHNRVRGVGTYNGDRRL